MSSPTPTPVLSVRKLTVDLRGGEDTPENRLEQARALTALEVEAGALDGMLDEGAALAREAYAQAARVAVTAAAFQEAGRLYRRAWDLHLGHERETLPSAEGRSLMTSRFST